MRNDERLRTIYEVMAPYIVRNEHNWRDYLAFASQFHKHSFDTLIFLLCMLTRGWNTPNCAIS